MQLQWKDDFVVFFTMTRDCHPPSPSAWSNTYLWVVELTWEIPRRIADGFWDAMQIVAVPMEDICIMVGLVVSVMLSWWLLCRELQDKMVVLNQQCWIRWLKMPGKQTVGAGGLQKEWCAWFPWETPLSFLGGKLLVLQVIFVALTERLVPLSSPHCIRQDRAPVMEGEGWGGCPLCLGLTWQDVKGLKGLPWYFHCSIKNSPAGRRGFEVMFCTEYLWGAVIPRARCWCVCTTVGRIFGLFDFKSCFRSSKIGLDISVCPVWCLNVRDRYRMWRGWIYLHAWVGMGIQKWGGCIFLGICDMTRGDMTRGDMDRDHWSLSQMKCFGYAGGIWLVPKLGEAWVGQLLPVTGNRLDLGEGRMCWERQTVLRLLKKKGASLLQSLNCCLLLWLSSYKS